MPAVADFSHVNYNPNTDWQGFFQGWFSPHVTFGVNTQDRPVETHVLNVVGSYGSQINRILDALSVLVSKAHLRDLTPREAKSIQEFEQLASLADKVASDYQNDRYPPDITLSAVHSWIKAIKDLEASSPGAYKRIAKEIESAFGNGPRAHVATGHGE